MMMLARSFLAVLFCFCGPACSGSQELRGAQPLFLVAPETHPMALRDSKGAELGKLVLLPSRPLLGELFEARLTLAEALPSSGSVTFDFWMPAHGHGMLQAPKVARLDERNFAVTGLALHMFGEWEIRVRVLSPGNLPAKTRVPVQFEPGGIWGELEQRLIATLSPVPVPGLDPTNRFDGDPAAERFGQRLFFDPTLSKGGEMSCATCHEPARYFTDGRPLPIGAVPGSRHTPSTIGAVFSRFQFWDGRADSLWSQAIGPLEAASEMGNNRMALAHTIAKGHRTEYESIFGALPDLGDEDRFPAHAMPVSLDAAHPHSVAWRAMAPADREAVNRILVNVGKAIAAYERRLVPGTSALDRYIAELQTNPERAATLLSPGAQRGLRAFVGEAGCIQCHNGPLMSDFGFHNLGITVADSGRGDRGRNVGVRKLVLDPFRGNRPYSDALDGPTMRYFQDHGELGSFKTPSLRNVAETAPYGHAGQFPDLQSVLDFYMELPDYAGPGDRDQILKPIDASVRQALLEFLPTLTGDLPPANLLRAPEPYVGPTAETGSGVQAR